MTTQALSDIILRVSERMNPGGYRPHKITVASGSATTLVSTDLKYSDASANKYDGVGVLLLTNADNAGESPQADFRRVRRAGFAGSTGALTVDTWSTDTDTTGPEVNDTAVLLYSGLTDTHIVEACNEIIRRMKLERWVPLGLNSDPGMENSGATGYTAVGGASIAKTTNADEVYMGSQALQVTSGGTAGDGVTTESLQEGSGNIDADDTEVMYVTVIFRIEAGTWQIAIDDGSTEIETITVTAAQGQNRWLMAWKQVAMQSGDIAVRVTITATTASGSDIIDIDSIQLLSDSRRVMKLPSAIANTDDICGVYEMPLGAATSLTDIYLPYSDPMREISAHPVRDFFGVHPNRIELPRISGYPLWVAYTGAGAELSPKTTYSSGHATLDFDAYFAQTVTVTDEDTFYAGVLSECYKRIGDEREAARHAKMFWEMIPKPKPIEQVATPRILV